MIKRIWTLFKSRNKEFIRDKSALGWNIMFPFLVIIGFSLMFSDNGNPMYKIGILVNSAKNSNTINQEIEIIKKLKHVEFIEFTSKESALNKLSHHRIDLLISSNSKEYWTSKTSPKSYVVEKMILGALNKKQDYIKLSITGREIPFVEWLFPGILGMNIMFSALFGVGYVVVRYRKNSALKRLSVTPLKPFEFLTSQIISRIFLIIITTIIVYAGCAIIYGFKCHGSYLSLFFIFVLGSFSMISLALLIASRSNSEEFAGGVLNLISWPMMFLSEVWFSLEGARPWVQKVSLIFPLTHMVSGARKIMNDGVSIWELKSQILVLTIMSFFFLIIASLLFKWHKV